MANKNYNQWQELEARLLKELPHVISFFTESASPGFIYNKYLRK